jgi:hypothetical protein
MWFLSCVLLVVVGFGSSFLCDIMLEIFLFSFIFHYDLYVCVCMVFLCSILYCAIGRFSSYFASSCSPDLNTGEGGVPVATGRVDLLIYLPS